MLEYKINEYITLKLRNDKTLIYVNEKIFHSCKYLLFNIPKENFEKFEMIESIDEIMDRLGREDDIAIERGQENELSPEIEFWGHCSNIQA